MIRKIEGTQFDYEVIQGNCPLPELGSPDWEWTPTHVDAYLDRYESQRSPICVISTGPHTHLVGCVTVASSLETAFRIAELLTRLEWEERSGKK